MSVRLSVFLCLSVCVCVSVCVRACMCVFPSIRPRYRRVGDYTEGGGI